MKRIFSFLFVVVFSAKAFAQNRAAGRLDSLFRELYSYGQINGNVLIAENGQPIYQQSFGYTNFKQRISNTDSSRFTLGSIAKVFTSTAILQLKGKGKLKLDDALQKYFPDFPFTDITIRHLLSHTSGLPDYELFHEQINKDPGKIFFNRDIIASLKSWTKQLYFTPGEKWQYSNMNFCMLALLVEKISGLSFQQYIEQNIFRPAHMYNTYFFTDTMKIADTKRAINHQYEWFYSKEPVAVDSLKKLRRRLYNLNGFTGQGNIITTTADLLNFDNALYAGKILKPSILAEAFAPTKLNNGKDNVANIGIGNASYGLGWFIFSDSSAGKIVWHTGGVPGGLSIYLRNISQRKTVITFDNAFSEGLYGAGINAMNILNNQPLVIRRKSLVHEYSNALLEKGIDAAFCRLLQLKEDSIHYYLSEDDINELGLQLLYAASFEKHKELALEVLKLNTLLFPNSFNTYDSYGEALANVGKKEEAIMMYKKSIALNPANEGGKKALEQLMKNQ